MKLYDHLPDNLCAPLRGKHVNCSPKGLTSSTFTIFDQNHAAYIDYSGSGSETIAHIYENGRVTVMLCSFDATPRIMRFFCWGSVIEWDDPQFEPTLQKMGTEKKSGMRAVIMLEMWKVQTSCGTGVPLVGASKSAEEATDGASNQSIVDTDAIGYFRDRDSMIKWNDVMEQKGKMRPYQNENNASSLDGLTALKAARRGSGQAMVLADIRVWFQRVFVGQVESILVGIILGLVVIPLVVYVFQLDMSTPTIGLNIALPGLEGFREL